MNIISKFSLYDIIAMVIPGFTILLFITSLLGYQWTINDCMVNSTIFWIVAFTLSYFIGIINELISRNIWRELRNNTTIVASQLENINKEIGTPRYLPSIFENKKYTATLKNWFKHIALFFLLFGLIVISVNIYCRCSCLTWLINLFVVIFEIIVVRYNYYFPRKEKGEEKLLDFYYEAYYYDQKKNSNYSVSYIEGQVAFLENMFIPVNLFVTLPFGKYSDCFGFLITYPNDKFYIIVIILLLMMLAASIYAIYRRIEKIHYLIWSDYEYLKRIKEKSNNLCSFQQKSVTLQP